MAWSGCGRRWSGCYPNNGGQMSIRKASGIKVENPGCLWLGSTKIHYKKDHYFEMKSDSEIKAIDQQSEAGAAKIGTDANGNRVLWRAESGFYWADEHLSDEEVLLLIWGRENKHKAQIERLRTLRDFEEVTSTTSPREMIPQETRAIVWQRDGGQCVQCGARDDLQYDHIIPVSKGGGNSPQNLQILCGPCNRKKSDSI